MANEKYAPTLEGWKYYTDKIKGLINDIDVTLLTPITYSELKDKRYNGELIPGQQYRITDYECTTIQDNTQSAGHVFDIIVTADSESALNENARAIKHDGDEYFNDCHLEGWELKYSLDNDRTKYPWAKMEGDAIFSIEDNDGYDVEGGTKYSLVKNVKPSDVDIYGYLEGEVPDDYYNGYLFYNENAGYYEYAISNTLNLTENYSVYYCESNFDSLHEGLAKNPIFNEVGGNGVIYYMKDENDNECPYDFKNIQFKRWKVTSNEYNSYELNKYIAYKDSGINKLTINSSDFVWCYTFNNQSDNTDKKTDAQNNKISKKEDNKLNNIVLTYNGFIKDCVFKSNCYDITASYYRNIFEYNCHDNLCLSCDYIIIGKSSYNNILISDTSLELGDACIGNYLYSTNHTSMKYGCNNNSIFGGNHNRFDRNCCYNIISGYTSNNSFGKCCGLSKDGTSSVSTGNRLIDSSNNNVFGDYCYGNQLTRAKVYKTTTKYEYVYSSGNTFESYAHDNILSGAYENIFKEGTNTNRLNSHDSNNILGEYSNNIVMTSNAKFNKIGSSSSKISLSSATYNPSNNIIGCNCDTIRIMGNNNNIGNKCYNIGIAYTSTSGGSVGTENSNSNVIGDNSSNNLIKSGSNNNTIGNLCEYNTIGNYCSGNTFGNLCKYNTLTDYCSCNTFGNSCGINTSGSSSKETGNMVGDYSCNNNFGNGCYSNKIKNSATSASYSSHDNIFGDNCHDNTLDYSCIKNIINGSSNTFGGSCVANVIGAGSNSNTFGNECYDNSLGEESSNNEFGNNNRYSSLGNRCKYNVFGINCWSNSFANDCFYNVLGDYSRSNNFGDRCGTDDNGTTSTALGNILGQYSYNNTLGEQCYSNKLNSNNTATTGCRNNSLGNHCYSNTFGYNCVNNNLGHNCYSNTLGAGCSYNSMGDFNASNSFGVYSYSNSTGNNCYCIKFNNQCDGNSFGNRCNWIIFGTNASSDLKGFFQNNIFDNGNQRIYLSTDQTTSSSNVIKNVHFHLGVNNGTAYKTFMLGEDGLNREYETNIVADNSKSVIITSNNTNTSI